MTNGFLGIKGFVFLGMAVGCGVTTLAQNPYEAERFASSDLNGSARYVAMGGALGALGGDMSVMSTNPAGTAMFRKSEGSLTVSGVFGSTGGVLGYDGSKASFDQCGFVVAMPASSIEGVTFGLNVSKSKNHLLNIDTDITGLGGIYSQSHQIAGLANEALYNDDWSGALADMSAPIYDKNGKMTKDGIIVDYYDEHGNLDHYEGVGASKAHYQRGAYGSTMDVDVNMSFNIDNKFFIGGTFGVYDVDTRRNSKYEELGVDGNYYDFNNYYDTRGTGVDFKLGAIFRPIEESAFRIGAYIHTPIWYELEDINGSQLYLNDCMVGHPKDFDPYRYKLRTPWQFGFSMGTTIENYFAIGAEYMFQDLSSCKYSNKGGGTNSYFQYQNQMMGNVLKGQHTVKVGIEVKPTDEFSVRCGYNFISAPMKEDGYNILAYDGVLTETDFCNWKGTNRFTFGVGYRFKGGYFDLTYQYSGQKGDFYAFDDQTLPPTEVKNDRSQVLGTIGFRF